MSFPRLNATLPPPDLPARSGEHFTHELAALVADIQRTKDWFNTQMDAQLASLQQLHASMQVDDPVCTPSVATLLEAPHPVLMELPVPEPSPPVRNSSPHPAIVLPPTLVTMLDPQLEQATLHELNNALAQAFSEISTRGGMLS